MPDTSTVTLNRRDVLTTIGYGAVIWGIATTLLMTLGPLLLPESGSWAGVLLIVVFAGLALGLTRSPHGFCSEAESPPLASCSTLWCTVQLLLATRSCPTPSKDLSHSSWCSPTVH